MRLEHLIIEYGYLVVLLGALLEGETVLILAGFAASRGYLNLSGVILCGWLGGMLSDWLFFLLGRYRGQAVMTRFPRWQPQVQQVLSKFSRYQNSLILSFRFLYGLRTVTPFAIGASNVSSQKFFLLNACGAIIWAAVIAWLGYCFGYAMMRILDDIKHYEAIIALSIVLFGGVFGWIRYRRVHR